MIIKTSGNEKKVYYNNVVSVSRWCEIAIVCDRET